MVRGLDVGYSHTKDNTGYCVRSACGRGMVSIGKKLVIDGIDYQVGVGSMTSEVDKVNSELNKVCTIYNLVQSTAKDLVLSVGLPIGQYAEQKERLKEQILAYNKCEVQYDGHRVPISISQVIVNPQGVSALYALDNFRWSGQCIVVDVGGLTVDCCLVEMSSSGIKVLDCDTWYTGMRTLYSEIIARTNNLFQLKLDNNYAEKLLREARIVVRGKCYTIEYLKPILAEYVNRLESELNLKYATETTPIYLVGGGAILLANSFQARFPDVHLVTNSQFANAIGYFRIANLLLGGEVQ